MLVSCQTALLNAPAVQEAFRAHRHWKVGAMGVAYPMGAPVALMDAVCALDSGLEAGQAEMIKRASKEGKKP